VTLEAAPVTCVVNGESTRVIAGHSTVNAGHSTVNRLTSMVKKRTHLRQILISPT
jgi:proline racemase